MSNRKKVQYGTPVPGSSGGGAGGPMGAKIAIGCLIGVLLVIGACVAFVGVGGMWLKNKVTGMAERYESDPDAAAYDAALMAFKLNPDLEVVAQDDDRRDEQARVHVEDAPGDPRFDDGGSGLDRSHVDDERHDT